MLLHTQLLVFALQPLDVAQMLLLFDLQQPLHVAELRPQLLCHTSLAAAAADLGPGAIKSCTFRKLHVQGMQRLSQGGIVRFQASVCLGACRAAVAGCTPPQLLLHLGDDLRLLLHQGIALRELLPQPLQLQEFAPQLLCMHFRPCPPDFKGCCLLHKLPLPLCSCRPCSLQLALQAQHFL